MMRKLAVLLLLLFILQSGQVLACTTAIVSGKYTADGRPLLWKHRDSGFTQNKLMYFEDGKYEYIGLVNSVDSLGTEVWGGTNSVGFAIINSASYNLKINDTTKVADREGIVMKKALQVCATISDFEQLLRDLPKPLGVEANFGVIDAEGGAAYFETDNFNFKKIDVNDPRIAPFGYVIRTNYSFTGQDNKGYGFIRYQTTENLFYQAAAEKKLDARFILRHGDRNLKHSLTGVDLGNNLPKDERDSDFVPFIDYVPRKSSVSSVVIQGIKKGEAVERTTLWTILGFPLTSVAVPTWVAAGKNLPKMLVADASGNAPLCDRALKLKNKCFPITSGSGWKYMNRALIINKVGSGFLQKLLAAEDEIFKQVHERWTDWDKHDFSAKRITLLYSWLDQFVSATYSKNFGL